MLADLALQQVGAAEPPVHRDVLGEVGKLEPDAHVVAQRHRGGIAHVEEAEHDPSDRRGGVRAVAAQRRPVLVRVDALVLHVGVDQVDEGLRLQPESAARCR